MSTIYTITDDISPDNRTTGDLDEVIEALRGWHSEEPLGVPDETATVIDQLRQALNRREPTDDLEAALAITVR